MTRRRAASRSRRAAGRLRLGGKAGRRPVGGVEEGVAPDQGDQGEVAVQARPGPSLVVAEAELLFPVLVEAFDRPALMGQSQLVIEGAVVEGPGEVPLGLASLTREGTLADEPAEGAGGVAVRAVDTRSRQACRWLPCCWGSSTVTVRHCSSGTADVSACAVCAGATWIGCGRVRGRPRWLVSGSGRAAASVTSLGSRTPNVLETWTR